MKIIIPTFACLILILSACGEKEENPKEIAEKWCNCVAKNDKNYSHPDCKKIQEDFIKANDSNEEVLKAFFNAQEDCRTSIINK